MAQLSQAQNSDALLIKFCDRFVEILLYITMLLVPIFFIIYTRDQFELPKLSVLRILTALMLGGWGVRIIAARQFAFRRTPLDIPILVWIGLQFLTTIFSVSSHISFMGEYENFRGLLTVLNYGVLYFIAVNFLRTRQQIDRMLQTIFTAGMIITVYGIGQFLGFDFIQWNPNSIAPGRYFSTLGNPNFLAAYLSMIMPFIVVFFVETDSKFKKGLLFLSFIAMFWALMGTWSRAGQMGFVLAMAVLLGFVAHNSLQKVREESQSSGHTFKSILVDGIKKYRIWLTLIAVLFTIIISISATFGRNHMVRMADTVVHFNEAITRSRLYIWGPAMGMIKDKPILGSGLDTFKSVFPKYATPEFARVDGANVSSRTAHNEILQVLSCQGIIGLIIVTWLTIAILLNWRKAYRNSRHNWRDRLILTGLIASWTAYSAQNIFSFGVVAIDSFYWMLLVLMVLMQSNPEEQLTLAPDDTPAVKPAAFFASLYKVRHVATLLIILASLWLGWQGLKIALADYQYNLGTVYRMQGMRDHCKHFFEKAATMVPLEVKYRVYLGLAYEEIAKAAPTPQERLKWIKIAINHYEKGQKMNPKNAYYLGNLGRAYSYASSLDLKNKEYHEKAVHYFSEAVRYAPVTVLFYQNLAMTHFSRKDTEKFQAVVKQLAAFESKQAAQLVFKAANQLYNFRLLSEARKYYEQCLELDKDYAEAMFNLGVTIAQLEGPKKAIPLWQRVLELKPNFKPAKQMLLRYESDKNARPSSVIINK